ncbi:hypothetical protein QUA41_03110 [Microcoleus sp. Pol11C1]|uniref:hypothetical protein n=1 Tax=Microcoleus sp. POL1_C1 TaxID=2818870 RepID=UPI002FD0D478
MDAAAAEILNWLHLFFRGISPKSGISIIVRCESAIAQNRCFLAAAPVCVREEKKPISIVRQRNEAIAKYRHFIARQACPVSD